MGRPARDGPESRSRADLPVNSQRRGVVRVKAVRRVSEISDGASWAEGEIVSSIELVARLAEGRALYRGLGFLSTARKIRDDIVDAAATLAIASEPRVTLHIPFLSRVL